MTRGPKITEGSVALNTGANGGRPRQRRFIQHSGDQGFPLGPIRGGLGRRTMAPLMACFLHSLRVEDDRLQFNCMYPRMAATGQVRLAAAPMVSQIRAG